MSAPRGLGTCACETCGRHCSSRQAVCDGCEEVARLRAALDRISAMTAVGYEGWDCGRCAKVHAVAEDAIERPRQGR